MVQARNCIALWGGSLNEKDLVDDCRMSAVLARPAELSKQEKNSDLPNVFFSLLGSGIHLHVKRSSIKIQ